MQSLPVVLSEYDCLLIGPSGCGKTLSFVLPVVARCLMQEMVKAWTDDDDPYAVICCSSSS
jgi:superfamily II DNA/RNA helicase